MVRQDLASLLTRLRAAGVASASFHADGRLAAVEFAGALPPHEKADEKQPAGNKPTPASLARRAFAVVQGHATSMDGEDDS